LVFLLLESLMGKQLSGNMGELAETLPKPSSLQATIRLPSGVLLYDCGCLGGCGPVNVRAGPHLGGGPDFNGRLRPCRPAPVGAFRPPPAPAGASLCLRPGRRLRRRARIQWLPSWSAALAVGILVGPPVLLVVTS